MLKRFCDICDTQMPDAKVVTHPSHAGFNLVMQQLHGTKDEIVFGFPGGAWAKEICGECRRALEAFIAQRIKARP